MKTQSSIKTFLKEARLSAPKVAREIGVPKSTFYLHIDKEDMRDVPEETRRALAPYLEKKNAIRRFLRLPTEA